MSSIKNRAAALSVVNWCLQSEDKAFWDHMRDEYGSDTTEADPAEDAPHHVFCAALRAVGVKKAVHDRGSVYVGDAIVDEDAAAVVCEYYDNQDEAEDYASVCEEGGADPAEDFHRSTHVYPSALRALGRKF